MEQLREKINTNQAQTFKDLVSPHQLVAIRSVSHSARVNAELAAMTLFSSEPERLTVKAASLLITALKILAILRGSDFCTAKEIAASMPRTFPATVRRALEMLRHTGWLRVRGHGEGREFARVEEPKHSSAIADENTSGEEY